MQPQYTITDRMLILIQEISMLTADFSLAQRELHLRKENRIRSIHSSLAIENNSLSMEQVTAILKGKRVLGPPKDIREVQNAFQAYEQVFQMDPYLVEDLLRAHHLLAEGLVKHPGQFRQGDVAIYDGKGQVVHVGARPQFVPDLVKELLDWARVAEVSEVLKSCVVHFELEIIHPFEDGNGRMGRLWQSLILSQWNPIFEWVPIESVIFEHQSGYYQALSKSNTTNDSTAFIEFMLEAILETLKVFHNRSMEVQEQFMSILLTRKEELVFHSLLDYFQERPFISNADFVELTHLSQASARRYLSRFVSYGLLDFTGSTRDRRYSLR